MKKILFTTLVLLSFLLIFTPFYSVGYILAVLAVSPLVSRFTFFQTYFGRFALTLAALLAIIPLVSLVTWLLGTENSALYNLVVFYGFMGFLYKKPVKKRSKITPLIDRLDTVAVITAVLPVIVIAASFFALTPNKDAALFQLVAEGWDNGSHISMLQDVSKENGYVYGPWSELKDTMIQKFHAYPQAWHLTTANFVNGFGGDRFTLNNPIQALFAYIVACLAWMVLTAYIFVVSAGELYKRVTNKKKLRWRELLPLGILSLCIHVIALYPSLSHGFTNYISTIAYILLVASLLLDTVKKPDSQSYILMILFGTMSVLTWFLVFPAVALMIFLALVMRGNNIKESCTLFFKDWRLLLFFFIGLSSMVLQIGIFNVFADVTGSSQLNVGSRIDPFSSSVGVFTVSQLLFGIIITACLVFIQSKHMKRRVAQLSLAVLIPWLIMTFGVYLYQNVTAGYNSYYMSKIFGISIMVAGVIFVVAGTVWINKFFPRTSMWVTSGVSIVAVCLLLISTGQSLNGVNKLFSGNTRTSYAVSEKVVETIPEAIKDETKIVVLTGIENPDHSDQDRHGILEQRMLHQTLTCAYYIARLDSNKITPEDRTAEKVKRLGKCADKFAKINESLTVITSEKTYKKVQKLHRDNINILSIDNGYPQTTTAQ